MSTHKTAPADACTFKIDLEVGTNGPDSKSAPVRMLARSGDAISHPYWGRIVHDMSGMQLSRGRVAIDYNHNANEVVGYLNKFDTDSGDLLASGALTPFGDSDRASEVLAKSRDGVPYEASINFAGDGLKVEQIREGQTVTVNGREFAGPGCVVREWPLRGVAITPYGADQNTETRLLNAGAEIQFEEVTEMTTTTETATIEQPDTDVEDTQEQPETVEADAAVDAESVTDNAEADAVETVDAVDAGATAESPETTGRNLSVADGARFLDSFGDRGGVWFAQGLSFDEAQQRYTAELQTRVDELERENLELRSNSTGAVEGGAVGATPGTHDQAEIAQLSRRGVPSSVARLAQGIAKRL